MMPVHPCETHCLGSALATLLTDAGSSDASRLSPKCLKARDFHCERFMR
jgi:hypothetical protein